MYVERLILGYLHLMINSRSEIALARIINTPDRELDHRAFTAVKHVAQSKGLGMYQVSLLDQVMVGHLVGWLGGWVGGWVGWLVPFIA